MQRPGLSLLLITLLPAPLAGAAAAGGPDSIDARAVAGAAASRLVGWRRQLHAAPELSNREEKTAAFLAATLADLGLEVRAGVARHGVIGVLRGERPGPTVAVRADMDALPVDEARDVAWRSHSPGVMHACGHDAHMAVALGLASVLAPLRSTLAGNILFLFQPAEEGPPPGEEGGAKLMVSEGALSSPRPEAIFALHVSPRIDAGRIGVHPDVVWASSDRLSIRIAGRQTHGAYPQEGTDPVVIGAAVVSALQTIPSRRIDARTPVVLTIGEFHAGTRFNIIPGEARLAGTMRAFDEGARRRLQEETRRTITGVAAAMGGAAEVEIEEMAPVTANHPELAAWAIARLRHELGEENVELPKPEMGAEDFGYFARQVPSFYFLLGVRNEAAGITAMVHTPDFDLDEAALPIGVRSMVALVSGYLASPPGRTSRGGKKLGSKGD